VDYKHSKIKQYHKEGRALRTETTINDTGDFDIGRRVCNLPALRQVGNHAHRRLLDVERLPSDPTIGADAFSAPSTPAVVDRQRAPALPFTAPRTQALLAALVIFHLLPHGFRARDLRAHLIPLLGHPAESITAGQLTYDLRRLRLHGLIKRIEHTHRYLVTDRGLRLAIYLTRVHRRLLCEDLADLLDQHALPSTAQRHLDHFSRAVDTNIQQHRLIARDLTQKINLDNSSPLAAEAGAVEHEAVDDVERQHDQDHVGDAAQRGEERTGCGCGCT
jgi:hypothetical protein